MVSNFLEIDPIIFGRVTKGYIEGTKVFISKDQIISIVQHPNGYYEAYLKRPVKTYHKGFIVFEEERKICFLKLKKDSL